VASAWVLLTAADGYIADGEGLCPFATDVPAVSNLAPNLLAAVQPPRPTPRATV